MTNVKAVISAKVFIAIVAIAMTSGCVSMSTNYTPEQIDFSEPELNTVTEVELGESMMRQGRLVWHDAIYLADDIKLNIWYTLRRGVLHERRRDQRGFFLQS